MEEKGTKEVLEFLLGSYRAKMAIENPSENCPFDFPSFLSTWKEVSQGDWNLLKKSITSDLEPLMQAGIFDSIIPYLSTSMNQASANKEQSPIEAQTNSKHEDYNLSSIISTELVSLTPGMAKSSGKSKDGSKVKEKYGLGHQNKGNEMDERLSEIVIHVCDEAKGIRQDFKCIQSILVQEMGYFSKVTVKGQRLKDMDISVHCDIIVFDWLMKWIRHKIDSTSDQPSPHLEPSNVIGLMVSAEFLQMPTLTTECLLFTSEKMEEVILDSPNLGCLNESLTSRLANHFDNLQLECQIVKVDRTDRISSRLYTQFIMSLNESEFDMSRGHFASTVTLFRCHTCAKLLINSVASKVPCNSMRFDCRGRLYSSHLKDPNWTLTNYIRDLKRELKSWRKVYWRLWGTVHFMCCCTCQLYFPAKHFGSCRYHPKGAQLSVTAVVSPSGEIIAQVDQPKAIEEKPKEECINPFRRNRESKLEYRANEDLRIETINSAFGSHPCCKKSGYKFYPLPPTNGCQFRDHNVSQYAEEDPIVQRIIALRDLIVVPPKEFRKAFEWGGIVDLTPPKLPTSAQSSSPWALAESQRVTLARGHRGQSSSTDSASFSETEDGTCTYGTESNRGDTSAQYYYSSSRGGQNVSEFWSWNSEFTTRYNQDMQREREEKLMADLELLLSQRVSLVDSSKGSSSLNMRLGYFNRRTPKNQGGSYIKLEEKWKDEIQRNNVNKTQRQAAKSAKP